MFSRVIVCWCCWNLCDGNTSYCAKITVKAASTAGNATCVMYESKPLACTNSIRSSINFSSISPGQCNRDFTNVAIAGHDDGTHCIVAMTKSCAAHGMLRWRGNPDKRVFCEMPLTMLDALSAVVSVVLLAPAVCVVVAIPGLVMLACWMAFRPCSMYCLCCGVKESNTSWAL